MKLGTLFLSTLPAPCDTNLNIVVASSLFFPTLRIQLLFASSFLVFFGDCLSLRTVVTFWLLYTVTSLFHCPVERVLVSTKVCIYIHIYIYKFTHTHTRLMCFLLHPNITLVRQWQSPCGAMNDYSHLAVIQFSLFLPSRNSLAF